MGNERKCFGSKTIGFCGQETREALAGIISNVFIIIRQFFSGVLLKRYVLSFQALLQNSE